jgi:hypothetical protein
LGHHIRVYDGAGWQNVARRIAAYDPTNLGASALDQVVSTSPGQALYRVSVTAKVTTAVAGQTLTVNVKWKDDAGTEHIDPVLSLSMATANVQANGEAAIYVGSGQNISITANAVSTGRYLLHARVENA